METTKNSSSDNHLNFSADFQAFLRAVWQSVTRPPIYDSSIGISQITRFWDSKLAGGLGYKR